MKISLTKYRDRPVIYSAMDTEATDVARYLNALEAILWERTHSGAFAFSDMVHAETWEATSRMLDAVEAYWDCVNCGFLTLRQDKRQICSCCMRPLQ